METSHPPKKKNKNKNKRRSLYFRKQNFLVFQEKNFQDRKMKNKKKKKKRNVLFVRYFVLVLLHRECYGFERAFFNS